MCVPYFKYVVCIIKQFQNPIKRKKKQLRRKHVLPHAGLIIIATQLPLIKTVFEESGKKQLLFLTLSHSSQYLLKIPTCHCISVHTFIVLLSLYLYHHKYKIFEILKNLYVYTMFTKLYDPLLKMHVNLLLFLKKHFSNE